MYYRKNDSRMGDEVFAMGLLLAPFAWKIVKKVEADINIKKEKFKALPVEEQARRKFKMCSRAEIVFKCLFVVRLLMGVVALFNGQFSTSDITSIISYIAIIVILKVGKKKYENNTTTTFK